MEHEQPQESASQRRVAFVTDAAVDVPEVERLRACGEGDDVTWHVLPELWTARVGGSTVEMLDVGEPDRDLIRIALDATPTVVGPGVEEYRQVFAELQDRERVWSVHAEPRISPSLEAARVAAREFPNVSVVQTNGAGIGVGLLTCRAAALAAESADEQSIDRFLATHCGRLRFLVVPDHFDPTAPRRMIAAVLLSGRPLTAAPGEPLGRGRRLRSRRATVTEIERQLRAYAPTDRVVRMAVGHAEAAGAVDPLLDIVERIRPTSSIDLVGRLGPRIARRVGSSCVGLAWMVE